MKKTTIGKLMQEMRGDDTQQKLAIELNIARETVSKYETGRLKPPADIAAKLVRKYGDPQFAIAARQEYTQTGPMWLDGPNVDLHHASVKEKTIEEMQEALNKLNAFSMARPLNRLQHFEQQEVIQLLEELAEVQTATETLIATICKATNTSYVDTWQRHYISLKAAGYVNH